MTQNSLAAVLAGPAPLPAPRCPIAIVTSKLDPSTRDLLAQRIADPAWTDRVVTAVLSDAGHAISAGAVRNHRREECACTRRAQVSA
jgi:hypothetical protein